MDFDVRALRKIGKYPVERFVAEGGMAWVFRVKDPDLFNAPRALKLLKHQAAEGDEYQRFLAEAQILATIQHPNLIHVYDFGQDAQTGCHFYTMDYIEGQTLADIPPDWHQPVEEEEEPGPEPTASEADPADPNATTYIHVARTPEKTRYTVRDICEYFSGVLAALARLHRENVVHRDIKPENIFLTHDGIAVLGDLGIAKGRHTSGITEIGRVPGTPLFMAPEHAMGDPVTVRSDVFSLGLSLFAVLNGETVYHQIESVDARDSQSVLRYLNSLVVAGEEFDFIFHDSIPDPVCDVIEKACRIDPDDRYQSADEFDQALRDAIDGSGRHGRLGPRALMAAGALLVVLAAGAYLAMRSIVSGDKAIAAEEAAARTSTLGDNTEALIDGLAALDSAPDPAFLAGVRADFARARQNTDAGRASLEDDDYDGAQQMFVRARNGYQSLCNDLTSGFLEDAAPARVKQARAAREQVEPAAEQIVPRDWKALEDESARLDLDLAATGCDRAQGLWDRIETSLRLVARSSEVDAEMSRRLPEVSTAAVASAEEARASARAFSTERSEYAALMEIAAADLERAKGARERGNYSSAIERAKQAKRDFERAASIRPADEARSGARALISRIEEQGLQVASLRTKEQAANQLFSAGDYDQAVEAYRGVVQELEGIESAAAASLGARNVALAARQDAEGWAVPASFMSEAEGLYSQAQLALRSSKYEDAERTFREALAGFQEAKRRAGEEGLIDPKASNAEALKVAQERAEQAERERKAEDERRERERAEADARERAARDELEKLRAALDEAKKAPAPQQVASVATLGIDPGLNKVMREYEQAYESRSIEDLNRVWSMSRFERLQIQRLFDDCGQIRVQVSPVDSNIKGATARVDYDETIVFKDCQSTRPGSRYSELSASLARRGDDWQIKTIRPR